MIISYQVIFVCYCPSKDLDIYSLKNIMSMNIMFHKFLFRNFIQVAAFHLKRDPPHFCPELFSPSFLAGWGCCFPQPLPPRLTAQVALLPSFLALLQPFSVNGFLLLQFVARVGVGTALLPRADQGKHFTPFTPYSIPCVI